jgi:hypothetical protein
MTSKERAKELISKFMPHVRWKLSQDDCLDRAKECALVACDEILGHMGADRGYTYWQEVKQEINKL